MASGGDIIPPNTNPNARENPGIMELETTATANDAAVGHDSPGSEGIATPRQKSARWSPQCSRGEPTATRCLVGALYSDPEGGSGIG